MKMFTNIRKDGSAHWKFVGKIFIFLFILRGVASLVESEATERGRNTTCSLRLTRQKVLIQEVEDPENSGKKRRIRRKYGIDNGGEYMSPDIVVEEFRIRAKINFQARPRTRRVAHTEISNHTKTRIDSPSFRDRRIVYCHAESLTLKNSPQSETEISIAPSTDRSIDIGKKNVLSEATSQLPKTIIFNGSGMTNLRYDETSSMPDFQEKSARDHTEIGKLKKKVDIEFFSKKKKKLHQFTNDKKKFLQKTDFADEQLFGTKNEEIARPKSSSVFLNFREVEESGSHPRYRKSTRNVNNEAVDSGIKKNARYLDTTRKEFFNENKNLFTIKPKGFLASEKVNTRVNKIPKWYKNLRNPKIKSTNDKTGTKDTKVSPFFEDYEIVELKTNKLDRHGRSPVSNNLKKKLPEHIEENKRIDVHEKYQGKSPKNYTIPFSSRLKKREANIGIPSVKTFTGEPEKLDTKRDRFENWTPQSVSHNPNEKSHNGSDTANKLLGQLQEKKSSKTTTNSTIGANKNSQKKTSKQSAKNKKKKSKSENASKKLQSKATKSSASKTMNSTRTNTRVEKRSNNTMWNFTLPSVIGKYFAFISSLLAVGTAGNKNHPVGEETNTTIVPNVGDKIVRANPSPTHISPGTNGSIFQNITDDDNRSTPLRKEINKTISSNLTDENPSGNNKTADFFTGKEEIFQNSTTISLENSTKIDRTILKDQAVLNFTQNPDHSSNESGSPVSPKNSRKAIIEGDVRVPVEIASKILAESVGSIAFETPRKINSENTSKTDNYSDIHISEKLAKIDDKSQNVTDFPTPTVKEFTNFSNGTLDKNSEHFLPPIGGSAANVSDIRSEDTEEKSTKLEELIKYTIPTGNLTKALREAANEKIEEYPEKTTINFTIIDPNCTEPFVQNSQANNTFDRSSSIVEVIARVSTFPTIKRYSRNDSSIDNTVSTKNDVPHTHNINAKNRQTKNSLGDYNSPNGARRGRGGAMSRGRMRSRYKGKDQYPSIPRAGKNSWRRNNVSATLNLSTSPNSSKRSGNFGGSVLSRENRKFPAKPLFGGFPDSSIMLPPNADHNKINATAIEETIFYKKSTLTVPTKIAMNDIYRLTGSTPPAVDDLSKEENKSGSKYSKKEPEPSTASSRIDFSTIDTIRTSPTFTRAETEREEDRIANDEISTRKRLTIGSSTIPYDKLISGEPTISTILLRNNLIVPINRIDGDTEIKIEGTSKELEIVNSKRGDTKELFAGGKIFEISSPTKPSLVSSEIKQHRDSTIEIDDNTVSNEPTTNSYEKSSVADLTSFNEIQSVTEKKITVSESPPITENEIVPGARNTQTTVDEHVGRDTVRAFVSESIENRKPAYYTTDEKSKYPSVTKNLMEFKYSTSPAYANNEPGDSPVNSRNSTEIYFPTKLNKTPQIRHDDFSTEREFSIEKEKIISSNDSTMTIYGGPKNHETVGLQESSVNSSLDLENKTSVNYTSITRYPDSTGREFFTKEEYVAVPGAESSPSLSSSNVVRKARDSRAISDYDDRREPEFDYDIDDSAEIEPATEKAMKSREDNAEKRSSDPGKLRNALLPYRHEAHRNIEGLRGSSTRDIKGSTNTHVENSEGIPAPKSSPVVVGLPHSAVHEVFFEDGEAGGDSESTAIPMIRRIADDQSFRASTARLVDNFNVPYELPETAENLTNFLDESKLLEFVESLEDFLFDDSVTGTSDRKPLPLSDQDLLAESTNSVAETRSAIFKTKKFSAQSKKTKNGKTTKRSGNERSRKIDSTKSGKKQRARSMTKKTTSDFSPIARKNRPQSSKKKIDKRTEKKIKRDKLKDKFRQVKISKTLMDFNSRRKSVKEQNSTDKIISKKVQNK